MNKEFSPVLIFIILLTMPIHFLVGFGMILRGRLPWSDKQDYSSSTMRLRASKKRKPSYKKPLLKNRDISYN